METGPVEPNAGFRMAGTSLYEFYVSLTQGGFTKPEALELIARMCQPRSE